MDRSDNKKILKASEYEKILDGTSKIKNAVTTSRQIIAEAERIRMDAYKTGYEQGQQQSQIDNIEHWIKLVSESINYIAGIENDLAEIVTSSIKKILATYEPDELAFQSIKFSLMEMAIRKQITLRAAPGLTRTLVKRTPELETDDGFINIIADKRLEGNHCVVESELGIIHVDVENKITELEKIFKSQITKSTGYNNEPGGP